MNLERKILLASIRELNELVVEQMLLHQLNVARANLGDLKDRVKRYGDNDTGTGDSGVEPHSD